MTFLNEFMKKEVIKKLGKWQAIFKGIAPYQQLLQPAAQAWPLYYIKR